MSILKSNFNKAMATTQNTDLERKRGRLGKAKDTQKKRSLHIVSIRCTPPSGQTKVCSSKACEYF